MVHHGVAKVVPEKGVLEEAFQEALKRARLNQAVSQFLENYNPDDAIPNDLEERITEAIEGTAKSWDEAIDDLAREGA